MSVREGYKQTEIGVLPKEWEVELFGDQCDIRDGTHYSPQYCESGIPFITSKNLTDQGINFSEVNYITIEDHNEFSKRSKVENGDILFGMIGTIGKPVIVNTNFEFSIKNVALLKFAQHTNLDNFFTLNLLKSDIITKQFKKVSNGGVQSFIALGVIRKLKIPLPPLQEQQKIAEILTTVDRKINSIDSKIEETKTLKRGLMQRLLSEGIGHSEFKESEIGRIPAAWEVKSIEDIADVKGGKRLPKGSALIEEKTPYPYIRVTDMHMGGVNATGILYVPIDIQPQIKNYTISKDDLFISVAGTLGIVGEVPEELHNANLTENADKLANIKINKKYLLYILLSDLIQNEISKQTTSNAQPKLALTRIKTFKIPVPPKEEQKQIAEILSTTDEKLETLRAKKEIFETLKKGLMQKLLSGEVRVRTTRNIMEVLTEEHIEKFGAEPYIIGMFWSQQDEIINGIMEAIENNKPYNEYELLSQEEQETFDSGDLVF